MLTELWSENLKGRDHLEYLGLDGNIGMDLNEIGCEEWSGFIWLMRGTNEHSNELYGSIKGREFLE
jgi:hypothetical protein